MQVRIFSPRADRSTILEEASDRPTTGSPTHSQAIELNNIAVRALTTGNYKTAIDKLGESLNADGAYQLSQDNLAITYSNYGLSLRKKSPTKPLCNFIMRSGQVQATPRSNKIWTE